MVLINLSICLRIQIFLCFVLWPWNDEKNQKNISISVELILVVNSHADHHYYKNRIDKHLMSDIKVYCTSNKQLILHRC